MTFWKKLRSLIVSQNHSTKSLMSIPLSSTTMRLSRFCPKLVKIYGNIKGDITKELFCLSFELVKVSQLNLVYKNMNWRFTSQYLKSNLLERKKFTYLFWLCIVILKKKVNKVYKCLGRTSKSLNLRVRLWEYLV